MHNLSYQGEAYQQQQQTQQSYGYIPSAYYDANANSAAAGGGNASRPAVHDSKISTDSGINSNNVGASGYVNEQYHARDAVTQQSQSYSRYYEQEHQHQHQQYYAQKQQQQQQSHNQHGYDTREQNNHATTHTTSCSASPAGSASVMDPVTGCVESGSGSTPFARWSWGVYPTNRVEGMQLVIPFGCMYSPLAQPCAECAYRPVTCTQCGGFLNPFSEVIPRSQTWVCVLCSNRNSLSIEYSNYMERHQPIECMPGNETVEYIVDTPERLPATFLFVVDMCITDAEELIGLKEFLTLTLEKLPPHARIGFITYGTTVQLHEINGGLFAESDAAAGGSTSGSTSVAALIVRRSLVLRGTQAVTTKTLQAMLSDLDRYVGLVSACADNVRNLIADLTADLWPTPKNHRPLRCTGTALSAAASLLELVSPNIGSCILSFISGVCTSGPGIVVDTDRENIIRSHMDIRDDTSTAAYWATSTDFYDQLMKRIVAQGHSLSCFTASLDQLGLAEMKLCIAASGGVVLNAESWMQEPFRLSLDRFFACRDDGALRLGLNATFEVITSPSWKVQGVIGPCIGTGKLSKSVADFEIGLGGTCEWTTCMLDATTTFAIYYDSSPTNSEVLRRPMRHTQIVTRYEIGREKRTRVTTLAVAQRENPSQTELIEAFDQETAAVLLARQAIFKTDSAPLFDVLRWLDRTLVRAVSRFGQYTRNMPETLQLPNQFVYFPGFIYHLRRSGYLQVFNSSPDESAIIRLQLLKSSVPDSIVQIQPTLYSYRLDAAPEPVMLDSKAIQADNILLLDTFFEVLVHYGSAITAWKKAGYAEQEEYAYLKDFLDVPLDDAQVLVTNRYPVPRLIEVSQDDPDARILYNRINPSRSYNSAGAEVYGSSEGELVYTDDASLQMFLKHLKKLAVAQ